LRDRFWRRPNRPFFHRHPKCSWSWAGSIGGPAVSEVRNRNPYFPIPAHGVQFLCSIAVSGLVFPLLLRGIVGKSSINGFLSPGFPVLRGSLHPCKLTKIF